jgi:glycerate kinase
MRVLVCPTAFKESLSATEVAGAIAAGVRRAIPAAGVRTLPLSDGGSGLIEALAAAKGGRQARISTTDPLGRPIEARVLWTADDAVAIESAEACGLHLLAPEERDPLRTATDGVGTLLERCAADGARRAILGLGGSATVDGGTGMARALGWRFLDRAGRDLQPGGGALAGLALIERPPLRIPLAVTALADVRSPLLGPDGAARRFAPQKGAGPQDLERLEYGLTRMADVAARDLGVDVRDIPGSGAAGGLGAGCLLFLDAELVQGADYLLEASGFEAALADADLLITGEGAWDATSGLGKITRVVLGRAEEAGVPALLVCGRAEGAPPEGVRLVSGPGGWLGADSLSALVEGDLRAHRTG